MFDPSIIFHRTQAGRDEIKQKTYGLTQSERLVLIMVDGVSMYSEVRKKLPSLTDERFERALKKLQQKELVLEVFMPVEGQEAEELEPAIIDRFLQQDPLDPVTVIMYDPDEELEGRSGTPVIPVQQAPAGDNTLSTPAAAPILNAAPPVPEVRLAQSEDPVTISVHATEPMSQPAMDDVHNELADLLAEEVRQSQSGRSPRMERIEPPLLVTPVMPAAPVAPRRASLFARLHWGYWLIGLGCTFIGTFVVAQIGG